MGSISVRVWQPGGRGFTVLRKDILRAGLEGGRRALATDLLREVVRLSQENEVHRNPEGRATTAKYSVVHNAEKAPTAEAIRAFQELKATGPSAALREKA